MHETDPLDADTDEGGVPDGEEVGRGTDPLDASDDFTVEKGGPGAYYGGCACTTGAAPGAGGGLMGLALALGVMLRRKRR